MRPPISLVSAWYARLCLSFKIHVLYSVCKIRLPATGFTLPWQLVAAHDPGPIYFCCSALDFADSAKMGIAKASIGALTASATRKQIFKNEGIEKRKESSRLRSEEHTSELQSRFDLV